MNVRQNLSILFYLRGTKETKERKIPIDRFAYYSIFASLIIFDRYCKMYEEKRRHWALIGKTPEPLWNYKTIAVNGFIR